MIDKKLLQEVIEPALNDKGLFLTELQISADNCIVVEIDGFDRAVSIDDCIELQHLVAQNFDRDVEDYELEVGSAGLTSPFKVPAQYAKNVGNNVEVLTADGRKLKGLLKAADDSSFVLTISKKVKPEGAKRPVMVDEDINFNFNDVKYTKYLIEFK